MPYSSRPIATANAPRRKSLYIVAACFALLLLMIGGYALYKTGHLPFSQKPAEAGNTVHHSTGNSATKGEDNTADGSSQPVKDNGSSGSTTLLKPTGQFVSNHKPQLQSSITSTCTTTPGATCQIAFSKDGVTKYLPAETTDAGGSVYWNNWQPQTYGLDAGSWTIQAVAVLNGQTATADDALPLEVSP